MGLTHGKTMINCTSVELVGNNQYFLGRFRELNSAYFEDFEVRHNLQLCTIFT